MTKNASKKERGSGGSAAGQASGSASALASASKSPIIFYCKDCEKIVDTQKVGRKYVYKCGACGTKNVAFGTEKSVKSFFRVKEVPVEGASEEAGSGKKKEAAPAARKKDLRKI